jgi:glycosyltransferase involved in cell wall biosynthesis
MSSASQVSVIIPAYNAERYLGTTLASIQNQTHRELEIIVVDDGSTDSTAMIAEKAARTDDRIRIIRQPNRGVAVARNRGLVEARSEFVAPMDADDVWHPRNLASQVAALHEAGPDAAVSYAWYVHIDEHGMFCATGPQTQFRRKQEVLFAQVNGNFIGNSSSTVMRRAAVEAVGGYDETLRARDAEGCEDQALYISLAKRWSFTVVPQYLIAYRRHPGSMSQDYKRMARSQALVLYDLHRHRPRLPAYWFSRGIARIYEGQLTTALLHKQWHKAAEVINASASISPWSLVHLLGVRLPFRIFGFCNRRLRNRALVPESEQVAVDAFWCVDHELAASGVFFADARSVRHPHRGGG